MRTAVASVPDVIAPELVELDPARQAEIDQLMVDLDGTPTRLRLGANAILGVSMAVTRAAADAGLPMMNAMNGGKRGDHQHTSHTTTPVHTSPKERKHT